MDEDDIWATLSPRKQEAAPLPAVGRSPVVAAVSYLANAVFSGAFAGIDYDEDEDGDEDDEDVFDTL